ANERQGRFVRRRLAGVLGVAAALAGLAVGLHLLQQQRPEERKHVKQDEKMLQWNVDLRAGNNPGLTPQARQNPASVKPVAVGETLQTRTGERRRVTLGDGSVLYLNQDTELKVEETRRVTL